MVLGWERQGKSYSHAEWDCYCHHVGSSISLNKPNVEFVPYQLKTSASVHNGCILCPGDQTMGMVLTVTLYVIKCSHE